MVMEPVYKKYVVATSFVIATAIFVAGILLGSYLDRYRINDAIDALQADELNTESYGVEQQFMEYVGDNDCSLLKTRLIDMSKKLGDIGQRLSLYESNSLSFKKAEYEYLKRRYFVLEARTYTYELQMKKKCNDDRTLILFFYRGGDDAASIMQGYVLDEVYKSHRDNISTHSFDIEFNNSTVTDLLESYYNITGAPAIVVNGKTLRPGFISVGELEAMVSKQGGRV